jgi:hypothetical protein
MKKEDFKYTFQKAKAPTEDYTIVPNAFWSTKQLSNDDKIMLGYLLSHKNNFKANKTFLAYGLGVSRSFVIASFKRLQDLKIISVAEDNTLTFDLSVVQNNTLKVLSTTTHTNVLSTTTDTVVQKDTKRSPESIIVSSVTTESVVQDNTNNKINKKKKKEEAKKERKEDKQEEAALGVDMLSTTTLTNVLPKATVPGPVFLYGTSLDNFTKLYLKVTKEFNIKIRLKTLEAILVYTINTIYKEQTGNDLPDNRCLNEATSRFNIIDIDKENISNTINDILKDKNKQEEITNKLTPMLSIQHSTISERSET